MSNLSLLVLLGSTFCLIIGILNPKVFRGWLGENVSRKKVSLVFGGIAIASFIVFGIFAPPPNQAATQQSNSTASKPKTEVPGATQKPATPILETKEEFSNKPIPFDTQNQNDSTLDKGLTKVKQEGVDGTKQTKFKVTYTDGAETSREKISEAVTIPPVPKIIANGTKVQVAASPTQPTPAQNPTSSCDPNYSGACVPIASDVDCAGGSGNGPAYVKGPVKVIGKDIYDLDRDGNGIGCEN